MSAQRERVGNDADGAATAVHAALALLPRGRWLVAVSGGRDSMALMHALARARASEIAAVASFDHRTGPYSRKALELVEREAERLGLPVVTGAASPGLASNEGAWRAARHAFLDAWAAELESVVVTAHTRDDEIETVVQRLLREAGPRGLAGMRAVDPARGSGEAPRRARPLLPVPRAVVADYASAHRIAFLDDPTNVQLRFQRNRIRQEILPALERAQPGFGAWCWSIGARAAAWRRSVDALVDECGLASAGEGSAIVPVAPFSMCGDAEWRVLWPAIAARAGVVMDRRGIERASAWAPGAKAGQEIPLSGEARIVRTAQTFVVRGTPGGSGGYILNE